MKSNRLPFGLAVIPSTIRLLPIVALLGLFPARALFAHVREFRDSKVQLPLILDAERAAFRAKHPIDPYWPEHLYYDAVVVTGKLEFPGPPGDYEPVGLHIDPIPNYLPKILGGRKVGSGTSNEGSSYSYAKGSGPDHQVPVHYLANGLSGVANKYVLMSARVEKRWAHGFHVSGSAAENTAEFEELLAKEGIEPKLVAYDFYVLLEAPGKELPFPYESRPRATQYEIEREAWLVKNEKYVAQGLIYQPTKSTPDAYPERDVRVRHAAAALAKLTGKEVFVQPRVEKRDFKAPKNAGKLETPQLELEALTQQLEKADVRILELNPRSLALVAD